MDRAMRLTSLGLLKLKPRPRKISLWLPHQEVGAFANRLKAYLATR